MGLRIYVFLLHKKITHSAKLVCHFFLLTPAILALLPVKVVDITLASRTTFLADQPPGLAPDANEVGLIGLLGLSNVIIQGSAIGSLSIRQD